MKKKTFIYQNFSDELVTNTNQAYQIPEDYVWYHGGLWHRLKLKVVLTLAYIISWCYLRLFLRVRFENKAILKKYKNQAYFIYGNHTLPQGDAALPIVLTYPQNLSAIVAPANLAIPVIGPALKLSNCLPLPQNLQEMKAFEKALGYLVQDKVAMIIYPEAHVWPYYTHIRPFSATSFRFPVQFQCPSFVTTVTYHKRRFSRRPKIKVYIDGPFLASPQLSLKEQKMDLYQQVQACMQRRSDQSTYQYVNYRKG